MTTFKERLERLVTHPNPVLPDGTPMATLITATGAKKILALLAAAKKVVDWDDCNDDDGFENAHQSLGVAVAVFEEHPAQATTGPTPVTYCPRRGCYVDQHGLLYAAEHGGEGG